jgi:FHA domain
MTYFLLMPSNQEALRIASDPINMPFKTLGQGRESGLQIGSGYTSKCRGSLVSFGRDAHLCDIHLGNSKYYGNKHCKIYIHPVSGEFVLQDLSSTKTTFLDVDEDTKGKYALQGDPRRRVIPKQRTVRLVIKTATFELLWQNLGTQLQRRPTSKLTSFVRTSVERESVPPPIYGTRVQQPPLPEGVQRLEKIDHEPRKDIGSGAFGDVKLTVDLDSGNLLAVKQFTIPAESEKKEKEKVKGEVLMISKHTHASYPSFTKTSGY